MVGKNVFSLPLGDFGCVGFENIVQSGQCRCRRWCCRECVR